MYTQLTYNKPFGQATKPATISTPREMIRNAFSRNQGWSEWNFLTEKTLVYVARKGVHTGEGRVNADPV